MAKLSQEIVNAFCPTGQGGGQKNTCSSRGPGHHGTDAKGRKILDDDVASHGASIAEEFHSAGRRMDSTLKEHTTVELSRKVKERKRLPEVTAAKDKATGKYHAVRKRAEKFEADNGVSVVDAWEAHSGRSWPYYRADSRTDTSPKYTTRSKAVTGNAWRGEMAKLTAKERQDIIDDLTSNCDCWKHPDDADVLNDFTDSKLLALKADFDKNQAAIAVANAAVRGFKDGATNDGYRYNPEAGQWEKTPAANAKDDEEDEDEEEEEEDDEEKESFVEKMRKGKGKKPTKNTAGRDRPRTRDQHIRSLPPDLQEEWREVEAIRAREKSRIANEILANSDVPEGEKRIHYDQLTTQSTDDLNRILALMPKRAAGEEEAPAHRPTRNRSRSSRPTRDEDVLLMPTMNFNDPKNPITETRAGADSVENDDPDMSEDEFFRNAPAHVRNKWQKLQVLENQERRQLIDQILANVDEAEEDKMLARLKRKSLDDLRDMAAVAAPATHTGRRTDYFGSAGYTPTVHARVANEDQTDLLPIPTTNWGEVAKEGRGEKKA